MNAYFDGYVHSNTMLKEFVVEYNKTVVARRDVKEREDFQTMNIHARLSGIHPIERVAAACTHGIFSRNFKQNSLRATTILMRSLIKMRMKDGTGWASWRRIKGNRRWSITHLTTGYMSGVAAHVRDTRNPV